MREHGIVIGAGVAGLAAALALNGAGFAVTLLDRDDPLPEGLEPADSWDWARGAAPQVRQPHFLMGRLRNLLHDNYPDLVQELFAAGVWELPFADTIHASARAGYRPQPGDEDMAPLCARRTTFEMVLRRYIERRGLATMHSSCKVEDLVLDSSVDGPPRVTGCVVRDATGQRTMEADFVIDASGRGSNLVTKLRAAGVAIREDHHTSKTVYNTRHYRLREGQQYPALMGLPAVEFSDFTLGALPADNGTLTVTLSVWKDDPVLASLARDPDSFDRICASIPKIAPWVDPSRVEALSSIISFANMDYLWRYMVEDGEPQILNFFLAGDSIIRTNPKFGRGCTWGTVSVHRLVEILAQDSDPRSRAVRYADVLWKEFRQDWEGMFKIECASRAQFESDAGLKPGSARQRIASGLQKHIMNVAMLADSNVQRAIMRGYHGLEGMSAWSRNPKVWLGIARAALPSPKQRALKRENAARLSRAELQALSSAPTV